MRRASTSSPDAPGVPVSDDLLREQSYLVARGVRPRATLCGPASAGGSDQFPGDRLFALRTDRKRLPLLDAHIPRAAAVGAIGSSLPALLSGAIHRAPLSGRAAPSFDVRLCRTRS